MGSQGPLLVANCKRTSNGPSFVSLQPRQLAQSRLHASEGIRPREGRADCLTPGRTCEAHQDGERMVIVQRH
jgi:hypothetical protein